MGGISDTQSNQHVQAVPLFRERLNRLLEDSCKKNAVTIVSGAGYGKSIAVSSYLYSYMNETVWLSVTPLDNADIRLWDSIISGFCRLLNTTSVCLFASDPSKARIVYENFLASLRNMLIPGKKYYLVLDDFHHITNPSILQFMEMLMLERMTNLCIILISREEIPIRIVTLIGKGILCQINQESMRLTKEELTDYFTSQNILLMPHASNEFYEYTGGWFFAAHLLCLTLKKGELYTHNPLAAIQLDIFKVMEYTIYAVLPKEVQRAFLQFSLFERLPYPLAMLLSGENRDMVEKTLSVNTFVEHDRFNDTINIHPLFLQFLHHKIDLLDKEEQEYVHLTSAEWFMEKDMQIDAIYHYEKIKRYDKIIPILFTFTNAFPTKTMEYLISVVNRMPDALYAENPMLDFLRMKFLMNNFNMREVERGLLEFHERLSLLPQTDEVLQATGEVEIHLALQSLISCSINQNYEFVEYFKNARKHLPHGSKLVYRPYISYGNYVCNVRVYTKGEVDRFIDAVERMLPDATVVIPNAFEGHANLAKAEYAYFQKNLKKAEQYVLQALGESRMAQSTYVKINALYLYTRICVAAGNYTKAKNAMNQQKLFVNAVNTPGGYAVHDMTTSWFYCQLGYTHLVSNWIKDEKMSKEVLTPITFATDKLIRAQSLLHNNEIYELLAMLNIKQEDFGFESFLFGRIEMTVIKAVALYLINERTQAMSVFEEAYEMAAPNQILMPFLEAGKYMRSMINTVSRNSNIPPEWLKDVKIKSATYAKSISTIRATHELHEQRDAQRSTLSRREMDVLNGIVQNMTREEIADTLNLSVNTIKSIMSSIYNKLGVNSNIEAIHVATQMHII